MTTFLQEHAAESLKLTADAFVNLYEIKLVAAPSKPTIYITDGQTVTWQTKTYDSAPVKMTGTARNSEDERARPTLTMTDAVGALVEFAHASYFDYGQVTRRRLLRVHADDNVNLAEVKKWYISRVRELIPMQYIAVELRSLSDGPTQLLPARKFTPPEFPFVTI